MINKNLIGIVSFFLVKVFLFSNVSISANYESYSNGLVKVQPFSFQQETRDLDKLLMSKGLWYIFRVSNSGMYKITFDEIKSLGFPNPDNVNIFGYGGNSLPTKNEQNLCYLKQIPYKYELGSDGIFNSGDYLYFYAEGYINFYYNGNYDMFVHRIHPYDQSIGYYLSDTPIEKKHIETQAEINSSDNNPISEAYIFKCYEDNRKNPSRSGHIWVGEDIKINNTQRVTFTNDFSPNKLKIFLQYFGNCSVKDADKNTMSISLNENKLGEYFCYGSGQYTDGYLYRKTYTFPFSSKSANFDFSFNGNDLSATANIDFVCLNIATNLTYNGEQILWGINTVNEYKKHSIIKIKSNKSNIQAIEVTDISNPYMFNITSKSEEYTYIDTIQKQQTVLFFDKNNLISPQLTGARTGFISTNLTSINSSPDMIILVKEGLKKKSVEYAEYRKETDNLEIEVITPDEIFNTYSAGTKDISAIRNMIREYYNKENQKMKYLLLFGDGTYDTKNCLQTDNNLLPVYEETYTNYAIDYSNSEIQHAYLAQTSTVGTDDFYGLLDPYDGGISGKLDIGIGRFPIQKEFEADVILSKLKIFNSESSRSNWKSKVLFIADDEDNGTHLDQSEEIDDSILKKDHKAINVQKIYFDAFNQVSTPAGQRYPEVTQAINDAVNSGVFIIDYIGHGNPRVLSSEEVLNAGDVQKWTNIDKLSIFVTASCEVGRFDDPAKESLGEWLIMNPDGGGIAALTTTRVVYSGNNHELNKNFHRDVYNPNYRLGDIIKQAKVKTGGGDTNKRNFTLLGDPALKLGFSDYSLKIDSIKNINFQNEYSFASELKNSSPFDTVGALSIVEISGHIEQNGALINFDGSLQPMVFDKQINQISKGNDGSSKISFSQLPSPMFNGQVNIKNGLFSFRFIIPKDINYSTGIGKISLYAKNEQGIEVFGYSNDFIIGGNSSNSFYDNHGPEIEIFMNDTLFVNGDNTHETPVLTVKIFDETGINTTGNGFGHDLVAIIDNDDENPVVLNNYFTYNNNSFTSGKVTYKLSNLSEGFHTVSIKAWDLLNNSSEASLDFNVVNETKATITDLRNYPNPANEYTFIDFKHNQANKELRVVIEVFDLMGNLVYSIKTNSLPNGFGINPIQLNTSSFSAGYYSLRVRIETETGDISSKTTKMMILR